MTPQDFSDIAGGIQSLLVGSAVLIGGGWAIYRFWSLRSVETARVQLRKDRAELEKTRAESEKAKRDLETHPLLDISLQAHTATTPELCVIVVETSVRNSGSGPELIDWTQSRIAVAKVTANNEGNLSHDAAIDARFLCIGSNPVADLLVPDEVVSYRFLAPVSGDGLYLVDAHLCGSRVTMSDFKAQALAIDKVAETDRTTWLSQAFVVVSRDPRSSPPSRAA